MWRHAPSRSRLHRAAAILDDRGLHDLTKNDLLWDKVVEITAIGEREIYEVTVEGADNVIVNGIAVCAVIGSNAADVGPTGCCRGRRRSPSPINSTCRESHYVRCGLSACEPTLCRRPRASSNCDDRACS